MTLERFTELRVEIKNRFGLTDEYQEDLSPGQAEVLEFLGPTGKMKMRFVTRPRLLDTKTIYSNRAGSLVKVDKVYSEDETVSHLEIFIWSEDRNDWQKIESESIF